MQLHHRLSVIPVALALVFAAAAHADTTYNLNATLTNGDVVSGTITFQNVSIPVYVGSTISYYQPGMEVDGDDFTIVTSTDATVATFDNEFFVGSTLDQPYSALFLDTTFSQEFFLDIPGEIPLQSFAGGAICSDSAPCTTYDSSTGVYGSGAVSSLNQSIDVGSGALTAQPTPEPSSMILLGSGLLGLAFVAFRKSKASQSLDMSL